MWPFVVGILAALVACRLAEWLPHYMDCQESALIAEILDAHTTSVGADGSGNRRQPAMTQEPTFWQWPARTTTNAGCAACILLIVLGAYYVYPTNLQVFLWGIWGAGLVVLAFVDARTKLLPDALTLPLMWLGLVIQLFPETRTVGLEYAVIGAVAGYLPLWLLALAYRMVRGHDGLGMGDLKLLAAMGAWSGPWLLPHVLLFAALLAIIIFVVERLLRRSTDGIHEERPFGPSIVVAYLMVLLMTNPLGFIS